MCELAFTKKKHKRNTLGVRPFIYGFSGGGEYLPIPCRWDSPDSAKQGQGPLQVKLRNFKPLQDGPNWTKEPGGTTTQNFQFASKSGGHDKTKRPERHFQGLVQGNRRGSELGGGYNMGPTVLTGKSWEALPSPKATLNEPPEVKGQEGGGSGVGTVGPVSAIDTARDHRVQRKAYRTQTASSGENN